MVETHSHTHTHTQTIGFCSTDPLLHGQCRLGHTAERFPLYQRTECKMIVLTLRAIATMNKTRRLPSSPILFLSSTPLPFPPLPPPLSLSPRFPYPSLFSTPSCPFPSPFPVPSLLTSPPLPFFSSPLFSSPLFSSPLFSSPLLPSPLSLPLP